MMIRGRAADGYAGWPLSRQLRAAALRHERPPMTRYGRRQLFSPGIFDTPFRESAALIFAAHAIDCQPPQAAAFQPRRLPLRHYDVLRRRFQPPSASDCRHVSPLAPPCRHYADGAAAVYSHCAAMLPLDERQAAAIRRRFCAAAADTPLRQPIFLPILLLSAMLRQLRYAATPATPILPPITPPPRFASRRAPPYA